MQDELNEIVTNINKVLKFEIESYGDLIKNGNAKMNFFIRKYKDEIYQVHCDSWSTDKKYEEVIFNDASKEDKLYENAKIVVEKIIKFFDHDAKVKINNNQIEIE